jgi:hypothetical protein
MNKLFLRIYLLIVLLPSITYLVLAYPEPGKMAIGGSDLYPYLSLLDKDAGAKLYCGNQPLLAVPDNLAWYPIAIGLFNVLPTEYAWYVFVHFHLVTGALFFYLLCGVVTKQTWIKAVGAFFYGISGLVPAMLAWGLPNLLVGYAYIPMVLWFGFRGVNSGWAMDFVIAAVYSGFLFLGGSLYFFYWVLWILALYAGFKRLTFSKDQRKKLYGGLFVYFLVLGIFCYLKAYFIYQNVFDLVMVKPYYAPLPLAKLLTMLFGIGSFGTPLTVAWSGLLIAPFVLFALFSYLQWETLIGLIFAGLMALGATAFLNAYFFMDAGRAAFIVIIFLLLMAVAGFEKAYKKYGRKAILAILYCALIQYGFYAFSINQIHNIQTNSLTNIDVNQSIAATLGNRVYVDYHLSYDWLWQYQYIRAGGQIVNFYDSLHFKRSLTCGTQYISDGYPNYTKTVIHFQNPNAYNLTIEIANPRLIAENRSLYVSDVKNVQTTTDSMPNPPAYNP